MTKLNQFLQPCSHTTLVPLSLKILKTSVVSGKILLTLFGPINFKNL